MVTTAVDEGRTMHAPAAGSDGDEVAEEWSPEDLSSAALVASSVLAKHGSTVGQVRWIAPCISINPAGTGTGLTMSTWTQFMELKVPHQNCCPYLACESCLSPT